MALQCQQSANGDDADRLDVEFSRLLCDDGCSVSYRGGAGTTQGSRGVDGLTATGLDAASRMWQEGCGTTEAPQQMGSDMGVELVDPLCRRIETGDL